MTKKIRMTMLLLSTVCILPLAACETMSEQAARKDRAQRVDAALEQAAAQASAEGYSQESLSLLERLYKRDSDNVDVAIRYARALRNADRLNRAVMVMSPFVRDGKQADAEAYIEYAADMAALGTYDEAVTFARKGINKDAENAHAYHVLGIALDAQGHHQEAETAFRKGLEYWKGDPSPILNNLGLNLATQGFLDEAVDTLRKAAGTSTAKRPEIERNLRIVAALQAQPPAHGWVAAPKPGRKPMKTDFKGVSVASDKKSDAESSDVKKADVKAEDVKKDEAGKAAAKETAKETVKESAKDATKEAKKEDAKTEAKKSDETASGEKVDAKSADSTKAVSKKPEVKTEVKKEAKVEPKPLAKSDTAVAPAVSAAPVTPVKAEAVKKQAASDSYSHLN